MLHPVSGKPDSQSRWESVVPEANSRPGSTTAEARKTKGSDGRIASSRTTKTSACSHDESGQTALPLLDPILWSLRWGFIHIIPNAISVVVLMDHRSIRGDRAVMNGELSSCFDINPVTACLHEEGDRSTSPVGNTNILAGGAASSQGPDGVPNVR